MPPVLHWESHDRILGLDYLLGQLPGLRETLSFIPWLIIRDITKGRVNSQMKEIHRAECMSPECRSSCPCRVGAHGSVHQPGSSPNPVVQGFTAALSDRHNQLLTPLPTFLSLENER
jgi:hypothetical protein